MVPEDLMSRLRAFQESRVLLTALELDVFNAIEEGAEAPEVAARLRTDARATEMLLNALGAIGMLQKTHGVYRNSPDAARYFTRRSPDDARLAMLHQVSLWNRWSTLTDCIRGGGTQQKETPARGPEWTEPFIAAMDYNARERAPELVRAVGAEGVRRMLDVGGGSGAYSIAFARANPGLRADILDLDTVVPIARRHIEDAGLADRITLRAGDLRSDKFPTGCDLVLISAICHMLSPEENRDLFRRAFAALSAGGRIAIQDFILDPDRTSPRMAALFALNMLVGTRSGNTYTEDEYTDWLQAAGFKDVRRLRVPGPAGVILATR